MNTKKIFGGGAKLDNPPPKPNHSLPTLTLPFLVIHP